MQTVTIVKSEIEWEAMACSLQIYHPHNPETNEIREILRESLGLGTPYSYTQSVPVTFPVRLFYWLKQETYLP